MPRPKPKNEGPDPFAYAKLEANANIVMAQVIYRKSIIRIRERLEALGMEANDVSEFVEKQEEHTKDVILQYLS